MARMPIPQFIGTAVQTPGLIYAGINFGEFTLGQFAMGNMCQCSAWHCKGVCGFLGTIISSSRRIFRKKSGDYHMRVPSKGGDKGILSHVK